MPMKIWLRHWVLPLFILTGPVVGMAQDRADRCLADICLKSKGNGVSLLLKEYGRGQTRIDEDDSEIEIHCYYDTQQKLWVELEISKSATHGSSNQLTGLFATNVPMCATSFVPKKPFPPLLSTRGLSLGLSEGDVITKLGNPNRRDEVSQIELEARYLKDSRRYSSKMGAVRLVYDNNPDSLLFNFYGLKNGVLISIWFAERE